MPVGNISGCSPQPAAATGPSLPANEIIIDRQGFRPSDWVDRIAAIPSDKSGARYMYAADCYPRYLDGQNVLIVRPEMARDNQAHFEWLLDFVKLNGLSVHVDRRLAELDPAGFTAVLSIIKSKGLQITWR